MQKYECVSEMKETKGQNWSVRQDFKPSICLDWSQSLRISGMFLAWLLLFTAAKNALIALLEAPPHNIFISLVSCLNTKLTNTSAQFQTK